MYNMFVMCSYMYVIVYVAYVYTCFCVYICMYVHVYISHTVVSHVRKYAL